MTNHCHDIDGRTILVQSAYEAPPKGVDHNQDGVARIVVLADCAMTLYQVKGPARQPCAARKMANTCYDIGIRKMFVISYMHPRAARP